MALSFSLPNKKEVLVNEILYKDLRKMSLYRDASLTGTLNFLESFILTKNLNVMEKLFTFFLESLEIDEEQILVSSLSEDEYNEIFNRLPDGIFGYLTDFVQKNKAHFEMLVFEEREDMEIDEIKINVLDITLPTFIARIFNCIDSTHYREMLFILCKRIPDVSFLINCTFLEIEDFYKLYADEVEKQNENLQNQNDS